MTARRILVVDDEDNLRSMLVAALKYEGYDVTQASDGAEGLRAARETKPDLIVLDVMMPVLDGFSVVKRLREAGDRTPIIFLTARDSSEDRVTGLNLGGDDYLPKPFSLEELVARVEAVSRRFDHEPSARDTYSVADSRSCAATSRGLAHMVAPGWASRSLRRSSTPTAARSSSTAPTESAPR